VLLRGLLGWASRWPVIAVCALLTVGLLVFFTVAERAAPEGAPGVVELELAFSEARFDDIVERWAEAGTLEVQRRNLRIDLLFPFAYSFLLFGLLGAVIAPSETRPGRGLSLLLWLPFIAGLLDWLENGLLLFLLGPGGDRAHGLIVLSSTIAAVKWILLAVSAAAIILALARKVFGRIDSGLHSLVIVFFLA
jgi:hypothetical protein